MIVSHKLKVIYRKLIKVAGTSFEIALSKYCEADDILTPIKGSGKSLRKSLGFCEAQNYMDLKTQKPMFVNHTPARKIKRLVPEHVWDNYLKIATIRCPYDMFISHYYFFTGKKQRKQEGAFEKYVFLRTIPFRTLCNLHDKEKILADYLIRYEHLDEDIKELESKIACPGLLKTFQSISAKKNSRLKTGASSCEMYSKYPTAKSIIDNKSYELSDRYEFFQKYWPEYKSKLEEALKKYQSTKA